ncbi:MAG: DUF480 domain-containing protein [Microthrixaceae bacterium]
MVDVPDDLELTAPQARVLGCLIEKQATTPEAYPLTLKALTTACNQSSSRYPVVDYDTQLVETTSLALTGKGLLRVVHPAHGERSTRYRHVADEGLGLDAAQLAVLAVLLLRGAQTVAELRTRTERLHTFATPAAVESTLQALAAHPRGLVRELERQPGQKETRWLQLLEVDPDGRAAAIASASSGAGARAKVDPGRLEQLERRVATLEQQLATLASELGVQLDPAGSGQAGNGELDSGESGESVQATGSQSPA